MTIHRALPSLRILHVFRAPVGGLFRHVVDLAREQTARGYEVGLFCDSTTGNAVGEAALAEIAPQLALGLFRTPMPREPSLADLGVLPKLARVRAKTGATVLHGHGAKGGAYARLVSIPRAAGRVARIYTPHGGSFHANAGRLSAGVYMTAERLMARRTDLFTFESAFVAERFRAQVSGADDRVRVIHNGVADAEFEPVDTRAAAFDLFYIGEVRAFKGVDTLLDAVALLRAKGRRVRLLCVGSGPDEALLRARAQRIGVSDAVVFEPPQPIRRVLGRGRLMVVPSRAESLPYVVLEAAAARQPLIATDVGGIPEIFGPLADALVPPDDPAILAEAILAGLDEPEASRAAFADRLARRVHAHFRIATMVDGVIAGYAHALGASEAGLHEALAAQAP